MSGEYFDDACRDSAVAEYPLELEASVTLPNLKRLHIRPLRPSEAGTIRDFYARLSPRTRYQRFLSAMPTLPDSLMRILLCTDYRRRLSLVAEGGGSAHPCVVGLGSFGAMADGTAELGLVVRDDWQRQRVGTELAVRVLRAAEDRGFDRFTAHFLSDNDAIRNLLHRIGTVVSTKSSGIVSELAFVARHGL